MYRCYAPLTTRAPQLLHWSEDGKQVVIEKPLELEATVLPRIYKQSKFSSFSRQLNVSGRRCSRKCSW